MTQKQFITTIAPIVQKYAKQYGIKVVSPIIAQACLESGYGSSQKAKHHNYFGLKYRADRVKCNNGYFKDSGSQQLLDGSYIPLPTETLWYSFDNIEKGIQGYFQFINIPKYANLKTTNDPYKYLEYIKADGYATSLNYVNNVYKVIIQWNLTQYDNNEGDNKMSDINITKATSTHNTTSKKNRSIQWIILHYTAGVSSAAGRAKGVANNFATSARDASADFIVDDGSIVQYNGDIQNRYTWAVGGSKYKSVNTSLGGKFHGIATNANSISIEMCSNKVNKSSLKVTDNDWYLTDATVDNAVALTQYLMKKYNIDINHVIMHHMVTGKVCPQPWCLNESKLLNWYDFLARVQKNSVIVQPAAAAVEPIVQTIPNKAESTTSALPKTPFLVNVLIKDLNIRKTPNGVLTGKYAAKGHNIISEVNGNWGKLESGLGWIYLSNKNYVTIGKTITSTPAPVKTSQTGSASAAAAYQVKIKISGLRIRSGPGTNYTINGFVNKGIVYTIIEEKNGWGKLKSGAGWISLNKAYVTKM